MAKQKFTEIQGLKDISYDVAANKVVALLLGTATDHPDCSMLQDLIRKMDIEVVRGGTSGWGNNRIVAKRDGSTIDLSLDPEVNPRWAGGKTTGAVRVSLHARDCRAKTVKLTTDYSTFVSRLDQMLTEQTAADTARGGAKSIVAKAMEALEKEIRATNLPFHKIKLSDYGSESKTVSGVSIHVHLWYSAPDEDRFSPDVDLAFSVDQEGHYNLFRADFKRKNVNFKAILSALS